jgi:hypothetical protein
MTVVVTLRYLGKDKESSHLVLNQGKSGVLNYDTGESAALVNADGMVSGRLKPNDAQTLRANFKVPKGAKKVGITLSGIGTFDDVDLGQ